MVIMHRIGKLSLYIIDALGGCLVASFVCGSIWLTMVRNDETATEVRNLARTISRARQDRRTLREAFDRQHGVLEDLQTRLSTDGHLPERAPVEEYFQTLSTIAVNHELRVIEHSPLPSRRYPGLVEERYGYQVTGTWPALIRFLRSIEATGYWADVSYLRVGRGTGPEEAAARERVADLTISLFSAEQRDPQAEGGGA